MFIATATQPVERVCQLSDRPTPAILLPSILLRAWTQEPASQPSGWRGRWWWRRFGMQSPWPQTSENHETLFGYTTHPVNCCRPTPSRRVISHRANDPPFISFRGMGAAYRHAIHPTRLWVCMQPQSYYPSSIYDKDVCRQREEEEEKCFVCRVFRQKSRRLRSVALIHNVMLVNGLLVVASKEITNKKKNKLATKSSVQCSIFVTPRVLWFTKSFGSQWIIIVGRNIMATASTSSSI